MKRQVVYQSLCVNSKCNFFVTLHILTNSNSSLSLSFSFSLYFESQKSHFYDSHRREMDATSVPVVAANSEWAVDLSLSSRWLFPFERLCVASLLRPFSDRGCRCDLLLDWLWRLPLLPPPPAAEVAFTVDPRSLLRRLFRSFRLFDTTGVKDASSSASITLSSLFESFVVPGDLLSAFDSCAIGSLIFEREGKKKK